MSAEWKRKLTSRKFWVAIVGLLTGILMIFGISEGDAATIGGVVMSLGSVIAYIAGEGFVDASRSPQENKE